MPVLKFTIKGTMEFKGPERATRDAARQAAVLLGELIGERMDKSGMKLTVSKVERSALVKKTLGGS